MLTLPAARAVVIANGRQIEVPIIVRRDIIMRAGLCFAGLSARKLFINESASLSDI
jgi:hypothetical protein